MTRENSGIEVTIYDMLNELKAYKRDAFGQYMLYGGMPRVLEFDDERDKKTYLTNLYSELYVKDIVERNHLEREDILNAILDSIASQIGSLSNPTNIAKRGYSVDVGVVTERTKKERIQREIDFVVNDGDRRIYIQSAYQMDTEQKENSELQSLSLTIIVI